jgi:acetolactate synthase I/II/III large subunit
VVFNNNSFGNVLNDQRRLFEGRLIGSELRNPDFVALAHAFGARGQLAESPAALQRSVADAIDSREPTVIEVPMALSATATPWPFIMPQSR